MKTTTFQSIARANSRWYRRGAPINATTDEWCNFMLWEHQWLEELAKYNGTTVKGAKENGNTQKS